MKNSFFAVIMLLLFTPVNITAATIVLRNPAPLQKESMAYLRQGSESNSDQWKLVVFGFTHCSDICPMSLANLSMLMEAAAEEQIKIDGIFVTVDPDRDTNAVLADYTKKFGSNISYLRLQGEDLKRFKSTFGVEAVFYTKNIGNRFHYQVDHSSTAFLIDPEGRIRALFDAVEDAGDIAKMIHEKGTFFSHE
ncbi:electron transport protein SCO1/SenC [Nitrosococcus halophilus Nc 4]|uniref:Electron transport protein SCO1/SenC n=1 Tax=Nitrosococcus halophilus (strain Nc4) TaxID=472759 RepID=D5BZH8_NITHN|nr:SCO family protein [Nitrosococcus halophilus]ADE16192.1 electron transport protein SCO1/SenC [Nitrosococcus halophilus Nc 4]